MAYFPEVWPQWYISLSWVPILKATLTGEEDLSPTHRSCCFTLSHRHTVFYVVCDRPEFEDDWYAPSLLIWPWCAQKFPVVRNHTRTKCARWNVKWKMSSRFSCVMLFSVITPVSLFQGGRLVFPGKCYLSAPVCTLHCILFYNVMRSVQLLSHYASRWVIHEESPPVRYLEQDTTTDWKSRRPLYLLGSFPGLYLRFLFWKAVEWEYCSHIWCRNMLSDCKISMDKFSYICLAFDPLPQIEHPPILQLGWGEGWSRRDKIWDNRGQIYSFFPARPKLYPSTACLILFLLPPLWLYFGWLLVVCCWQ